MRKDETEMEEIMASEMPTEAPTAPMTSEEQAPEHREPLPDTQEQAPLEAPPTDYSALAEADLAQLRALFPECRALTHLGELDNPRRYAELRDAGLSPKEAFLATDDGRMRQRRYDNRAHLHSVVPKGASGGQAMTAAELAAARELFDGLSDADLASLYRRAKGVSRK